MAVYAHLSAAFTFFDTVETIATIFTNLTCAVDAATTFHTADNGAVVHMHQVRSPAVHAVGAIVERIVTLQAVVMVIVIPCRAFFNAAFAAAADIAISYDYFIIHRIKQAQAAVRTRITVVVGSAEMVCALTAHTAAAIIIAQAAVLANRTFFCTFGALVAVQTQLGAVEAYAALFANLVVS